MGNQKHTTILGQLMVTLQPTKNVSYQRPLELMETLRMSNYSDNDKQHQDLRWSSVRVPSTPCQLPKRTERKYGRSYSVVGVPSSSSTSCALAQRDWINSFQNCYNYDGSR